MNAHQKANLESLSNYLKGPLQAEFNMAQFHDGADSASPTCGTVGCAVGHATLAIEPLAMNPGHYYPESYYSYAKRVLGVDYIAKEWDWMFSDKWALRHDDDTGEEITGPDNTPQGAAARIDVFLQRGVPEDYLQQMYGEVPLCY